MQNVMPQALYQECLNRINSAVRHGKNLNSFLKENRLPIGPAPVAASAWAWRILKFRQQHPMTDQDRQALIDRHVDQIGVTRCPAAVCAPSENVVIRPGQFVTVEIKEENTEAYSRNHKRAGYKRELSAINAHQSRRKKSAERRAEDAAMGKPKPLVKRYVFTDEDIDTAMRLRSQGKTWIEIGDAIGKPAERTREKCLDVRKKRAAMAAE